jgi:hypothetical protein
MELEPYVDEIRRQLTLAADTDDAGRMATERLLTALDAAVRLAVQHALADAADEITCDLAPGSVELRVRGRELAFAVTPPTPDASRDGRSSDDVDSGGGARDASADDEREMVRINVRMPDSLKARIEEAAGAQRVSINAWLVRAASLALERPRASEPRSSPGARHYRGWAR